MRFVLCIAFIFSALCCIGQGDRQQLDTIRVASTQIPLKLNETGRHITVYEGRHLRSIPSSSLDEVLQTIPGIEIQSRGGFGVQGDIVMRGSTFTQVLVLIDGMKMNDPLTAHFNSNIPVTNQEIRRIEVLRGPAAAMYGPDAVGGVINIITKNFAPNSRDQSTLYAEIGLGSHGQKNGNASAQYVGNRLRVAGSLQLNQADGELIQGQQTSSGALEDYRNFFNVKTGSLSLGYRMKNGYTLNARSGYDYRDFNARYFYTTSTFDKSTETVTNWFNHIRLEKTSDRSNTDVSFAYKRGTDEFVFSPDFPSTNNHTTDFFNILANRMVVLNDQLTLKYGVQVDNRAVESNDRGNHEDWHFGTYAMGAYRKGPWNFSASVRMDYDENYDFEISPQINTSFINGNFIGRAAIGRSIRAADYTERYVSNNLMNLTPGRSLGNPDLLAESSWSEELGFDCYLTRAWKVSATGFLRQSERLIDYVSTPSDQIVGVGDLQEDAAYFFAQNISSVQTRGLELTSDIRMRLNDAAEFSLLVGYTTVRTENDDGIISVYLANHARHLWNSTAALKYKKWNAAVTTLFKERQSRQAMAINETLSPNYFLVHLRLGLQISEQLGIQAQVQNIFDERYQNILGAVMPGRWIMASLSFSLGG
ncbi:MAG: TonB-dependent receptor [Saprospiraceae bacterium]|nr:TonB-dependent receptor [Saprospiraceae bacterium]